MSINPVESILGKLLTQATGRMRTAMPGIVIDYDTVLCEASVKQAIPELDDDGNVLPSKVINHVPVLWLGTSSSRITLPVAEGDTCLLICCYTTIDDYMASGQIVAPKLRTRRHSLNDAVALMGFDPRTITRPSHATAAVWEGNDIRMGDAVTAASVAFTESVNLLRTSVNELISAWKVHTHAAPGGATGVPNNASSVGTAAAVQGTAKAKLS